MTTVDRTLRKRRQDTLDFNRMPLIPFVIQGVDYLIYKNANLTVFSLDCCNAKCPFCIYHLRRLCREEKQLGAPIKDVDKYCTRLSQIAEILRPLDVSVSINGMEPSVDPKLPQILQTLENHDFRKRTITTNGSGLLRRIAGSTDTFLDKLVQFNFAHLNISRAHYNDDVNQQIMGIARYVSNEEIRKAAAIAKQGGIRPRLSCVLLQGHIDRLEQVTAYLDWARELGFDNVIFRELMRFDPSEFRDHPITHYCLDRTVAMEPILMLVDHDPRFTFVKQNVGNCYYYEVFIYRDMIEVVFEMAGLGLIDKIAQRGLKATGGTPIIYEFTLYPSGDLCGSWRKQHLVPATNRDRKQRV